jgi:hypothetical protein
VHLILEKSYFILDKGAVKIILTVGWIQRSNRCIGKIVFCIAIPQAPDKLMVVSWGKAMLKINIKVVPFFANNVFSTFGGIVIYLEL